MSSWGLLGVPIGTRHVCPRSVGDCWWVDSIFIDQRLASVVAEAAYGADGGDGRNADGYPREVVYHCLLVGGGFSCIIFNLL